MSSGAAIGALALLGVLLWPASQPRELVAHRRQSARPTPGRARRQRVRGRASDSRLLILLDVLAPSLRSGRSPAEAVRLAGRVIPDADDSAVSRERTPDPGHDLVRDLGTALDEGRSPDAVLRRAASTEERLLAAAWGLSSDLGAPLAEAVECAAGLMRSRAAQHRRLEAAVAGARATMRMLTLLPLAGPLLAVAVGVDPVAAYATSPPAWGCLLLGVGLVLAGRAWVERLVADVARGPVLP